MNANAKETSWPCLCLSNVFRVTEAEQCKGVFLVGKGTAAGIKEEQQVGVVGCSESQGARVRVVRKQTGWEQVENEA